MNYTLSFFISAMLFTINVNAQSAFLEHPLAPQIFDNEPQRDLLSEQPALSYLWFGYGFSIDYQSPRSHDYSLTDVSQTLRWQANSPPSASCWTCKSADVPALMAQQTEFGFSSNDFITQALSIKQAIGCNDCHLEGKSTLSLTRPHSQRAYQELNLDFAQQPPFMQASMSCGQCHAEYYFQSHMYNRIIFPWLFGIDAESQLAYYDSRDFSDWKHPKSNVPMLKAQHPEFETWYQSVHAREGVGCNDCHMSSILTKANPKIQNHIISPPMDNFKERCQRCHKSQIELTNKMEHYRAEIRLLAEDIMLTLVQAHVEAETVQAHGKTANHMPQTLNYIRTAQWYWDYATASHGIYAHNPKLAIELLNKSKKIVTYARIGLLQDLASLKIIPNYPNITSKEEIQKYLKINVIEIKNNKQIFLNKLQRVWPTQLKTWTNGKPKSITVE